MLLRLRFSVLLPVSEKICIDVNLPLKYAPVVGLSVIRFCNKATTIKGKAKLGVKQAFDLPKLQADLWTLFLRS